MDESKQLLKAQKAADSGKIELARNLLDDLIYRNPANEKAWLALSKLVDNSEEEAECLRRAISINPDISTKMRLAGVEEKIKSQGEEVSYGTRDKIWAILERGPLDSGELYDMPLSSGGFSRNRHGSSGGGIAMGAVITSLKEQFDVSDIEGKIEVTLLGGFLLLFVGFITCERAGLLPLFLQLSIIILFPGFLTSCGLWIWRVYVKKISIPSAEKKLIIFAALYLAGSIIHFLVYY